MVILLIWKRKRQIRNGMLSMKSITTIADCQINADKQIDCLVLLLLPGLLCK